MYQELCTGRRESVNDIKSCQSHMLKQHAKHETQCLGLLTWLMRWKRQSRGLEHCDIESHNNGNSLRSSNGRI